MLCTISPGPYRYLLLLAFRLHFSLTFRATHPLEETLLPLPLYSTCILCAINPHLLDGLFICIECTFPEILVDTYLNFGKLLQSQYCTNPTATSMTPLTIWLYMQWHYFLNCAYKCSRLGLIILLLPSRTTQPSRWLSYHVSHKGTHY